MIWVIVQYGDCAWAFRTKREALAKLKTWKRMGIADGAKLVCASLMSGKVTR